MILLLSKMIDKQIHKQASYVKPACVFVSVQHYATLITLNHVVRIELTHIIKFFHYISTYAFSQDHVLFWFMEI